MGESSEFSKLGSWYRALAHGSMVAHGN